MVICNMIGTGPVLMKQWVIYTYAREEWSISPKEGLLLQKWSLIQVLNGGQSCLTCVMGPAHCKSSSIKY